MNDTFPVELLRPSIRKILKEHYPDLLRKKSIGIDDLNKVRRVYFLKVLEAVEENDELREDIVNSLLSDKFVVDNTNEKVKNETTLGDSISMAISSFLGSWFFVAAMLTFVGGWVAYNLYSASHFDAYPFAMLGFLLTAVSAIQSPLILNSQKMQSDRDRIKFDEDFQTNIKSELEIRNLHSKMDYYNKMIWEKLDAMEKSQRKSK